METEAEKLAATSLIGHLKFFFFLLVFRKKAAPIGIEKVTVYKPFNRFFTSSLKNKTLVISAL